VRANRKMAEILWPRRETRRQTEKTNLGLYLREKLIYSTNAECVVERWGEGGQ